MFYVHVRNYLNCSHSLERHLGGWIVDGDIVDHHNEHRNHTSNSNNANNDNDNNDLINNFTFETISSTSFITGHERGMKGKKEKYQRQKNFFY